ncbi:hypothetical protein G9A89_016134 [Geosiphon pyriformis]|nr:hypothetical protein G9A89_016134 [Geosiphon pyriformis]
MGAFAQLAQSKRNMSGVTYGPRSAKWRYAHMARETWSKFFRKRIPRIDPKVHWVHPKDRIAHWKILEGDQVKIIAGQGKRQVGKVKKIDMWTNRVWVENCNIGLRTPRTPTINPKPPPPREKRIGGWWMEEIEKPIHVSNVLLVHPDDLQSDIKDEDKRGVRCQWRKITIKETGKGRFRWRRFVPGTDIQIPLPPRDKKSPEDLQEETRFDTPVEAVNKFTFIPNYSLPLPSGVIDELRDKYKTWRYTHRGFI